MPPPTVIAGLDPGLDPGLSPRLSGLKSAVSAFPTVMVGLGQAWPDHPRVSQPRRQRFRRACPGCIRLVDARPSPGMTEYFGAITRGSASRCVRMAQKA